MSALEDHVAFRGKNRKACRGLEETPEGKKSLGRHMCRWKDNTDRNLKELGWEGVD
jgi:hypothetical protein